MIGSFLSVTTLGFFFLFFFLGGGRISLFVMKRKKEFRELSSMEVSDEVQDNLQLINYILTMSNHFSKLTGYITAETYEVR